MSELNNKLSELSVENGKIVIKKSTKKEPRLVLATSSQWDSIQKVADEIGVTIPENLFNKRVYANSSQVLRSIDFKNFTKFSYNKRALLSILMLRSIGLEFEEGENNTYILSVTDKFDFHNFAKFMKGKDSINATETIQE